jgi:GH43 family beta-xylosidase
MNSKNIWAPEIHYIQGKWYIYFAADDGNNENHRMFVIESNNPLGPYQYPEGTKKGKMTEPSDKWAIDGTVLQNNSNLYFLWSGWEGEINVRQNLYIAPMSNPWTISGERVEIARPTYNWEKIGEPHVNEGPQVLKQNHHLFIIFSASGSWTEDYCLGVLTLNGTNVLDPASWEKQPESIFQKSREADVYGPGHCGFTKSPDLSEDWIIYHAQKKKGSGWDRNIRAQKFTWNEDHLPNFRNPVSLKKELKVPSGESLK